MLDSFSVIADPWFYAVAVPAVLLGVLTLGFLVQRLFLAPRAGAPAPAAWVGRVSATAAGFTSFVAHAGGPPLIAYLLPMKMAPRVLSATMAVFFAVINAATVLPYTVLGLMDLRNLATALLLLPLAPLGLWAGVWLVCGWCAVSATRGFTGWPIWACCSPDASCCGTE